MKPPTESEGERIVEEFLCGSGGVNPKDLRKYPAYLRFYGNVICPSNSKDAVVPIDNPAFTTHNDVYLYAKRLKTGPEQTRHDLISRFTNDAVSDRDKEAAVRALVRVSFMMDCASKQTYPEGFNIGDFVPLTWADSERFVDFVKGAFPTSHAHTPSQCEKIYGAHAQKRRLKAWKLRKRYHITFRATDDITEHLLYNARERTINIFHHTGWLKAHLLRSLTKPLDMGFDESLKL